MRNFGGSVITARMTVRNFGGGVIAVRMTVSIS